MNKSLVTRVVHVKREPYDTYIGRPSKWANPYTHKDGTTAKYKVDTREQAIEAYYYYITEGEGQHLLKDLDELKGKTLGCWCSPKPCHGDILISLVEKYCKNNNG